MSPTYRYLISIQQSGFLNSTHLYTALDTFMICWHYDILITISPHGFKITDKHQNWKKVFFTDNNGNLKKNQWMDLAEQKMHKPWDSSCNLFISIFGNSSINMLYPAKQTSFCSDF